MSRWLAYGRLLRIPNVFTALADVSIGVMTIGVSPAGGLVFVTSGCLYSAGMAWNDYVDRAVDAMERPSRPIPSGQITPTAARRIGLALAGLGVLSGGLAGWSSYGWSQTPLLITTALLGLILSYNGGLKSMVAAPFILGGCRFLNVLLGFSTAVPFALTGSSLAAASIVGVYVVGITLFARDEAAMSRRDRLAIAAGVCLTAVTAALLVPNVTSHVGARFVPYAVTVLLIGLLARLGHALKHPSPGRVQSFVKAAILAIIPLDACLAAAVAGPSGWLIILWLVPAVVLGRRVYST